MAKGLTGAGVWAVAAPMLASSKAVDKRFFIGSEPFLRLPNVDHPAAAVAPKAALACPIHMIMCVANAPNATSRFNG
ncbi:hypothetical protein GCM10027048_09560 [Hymenobacter coalescens]